MGFWSDYSSAISKVPNEVPTTSPDDLNRSSFRNTVFCRMPDDGQRPENPLQLCRISEHVRYCGPKPNINMPLFQSFLGTKPNSRFR
jgi:hypothetical protein